MWAENGIADNRASHGFRCERCVAVSAGCVDGRLLCAAYAELGAGDAGVINGSEGLVEFAMNMVSCARTYSMEIDDPARIG